MNLMYLLHDAKLSQILIIDSLCQVDSDICLGRTEGQGQGEEELHLSDGEKLVTRVEVGEQIAGAGSTKQTFLYTMWTPDTSLSIGPCGEKLERSLERETIAKSQETFYQMMGTQFSKKQFI